MRLTAGLRLGPYEVLSLLGSGGDGGGLLEQRTISPPEPGGAQDMVHLVISPDGRHVVFMFERFVGTLSIARGLWTPAR